jgi:hypothetical protein
MQPLRKLLSDPLPPGPHPARPVIFADLGTHPTLWGPKAKIGIAFEVYVTKGDKTRTVLVAAVLNRTLAPKGTLHGYVLAILGEVPDVLLPEQLLGGAVLVTLKNTQGTSQVFVDILTVSPVPAGFPVPPAQSALMVYDLDAPDPVIFAKLPPRFQKMLDTQPASIPGDRQADDPTGHVSPPESPFEPDGGSAARTLGDGHNPLRINPFYDEEAGGEFEGAFPGISRNPFGFN